jgi:hypothetical protein
MALRSSFGKGFKGSRDEPSKALYNMGQLKNLLD